MKIKENAKVISQEELAPGIFSLWLSTRAAEYAVPGQFVALYSADASRLLPRPISICENQPAEKKMRLVYRVAGAGTGELSGKQAGEEIPLLGPLGNGFPLEGKHPMVVGGGIGVPPMLLLAQTLSEQEGVEGVTAVMGYRNDDTFLSAEFIDTAEYVIATDDGSVGVQGTVVDAIEENGITCDVMYACGPKPMLRALKAYAAKQGIRLYISMEERMACGIGACLACVCKSTETDAHSQVKNKRVCADGPVFLADDIDLD